MTLAEVVASLTYKPGWRVQLRTVHGVAALWVDAVVVNSDPPHDTTTIQHLIPVPPTLTVPGSEESTRRWVYDALLGVERHELGEWLRFDGERPFMPYHGETGGDPYRAYGEHGGDPYSRPT